MFCPERRIVPGMANIKRFIFNLILIAVFLLVIVLITMPLLAELEFTSAQKMADSNRWDEASSRFEKAIWLDPFNSRYLYDFSGSLVHKSEHNPDKMALLKKAEILCRKAAGMDPLNADYPLRLGQIRLDMDRSNTADAFDNFKKALKNDPNGFNVSYAVGYAGMAVWDRLDDFQREMVLDRLKHSLAVYPIYGNTIYRLVWQKTVDFKYLERITPGDLNGHKNLYDFITTNDLWQFRRQEAGIISRYKEKEGAEKLKKDKKIRLDHLGSMKKSYMKGRGIPQISDNMPAAEWSSMSPDGNKTIADGLMYSNGTIYMVINARPGWVDISIEAKKFLIIKIADIDNPKFNPYMIVKLDDDIIGETFVANDDWKKYQFSIKTDGGLKVLSVTFVNDIYDAGKGEDRNLGVGNVSIAYR